MPMVFILQKLEGAPYEFTHFTPLYLPKPLFRSTFVTLKQGLDAVQTDGRIKVDAKAKSECDKQEVDTPSEQDAGASPFSIEDTRLLIVDDNMINREVAKGVLECLPSKLFTCADGEEVIAFLQKCKSKGRKIHSILMDCQMPNMNGYQATRAIREGKAGMMHVNVPIIAMTANAMLGEKEKCLEAGMNDFATKPIIADVLIPKVRQWLVHQVTSLVSTDIIGIQSPALENAKQGIYDENNPPLVDSLLSAIDNEVKQRVDAADDFNETGKHNMSDDVLANAEPSELSAKPEKEPNQRLNALSDEYWQKDDAIERIMGDKALFTRVCDLYSQNAPEKFKLLEKAVEGQDFTQVQVLSLKLKGMSADIGAVQLQKEFEALWELSKVADWVKVKAQLPSIGDDLNTFIELLDVA